MRTFIAEVSKWDGDKPFGEQGRYSRARACTTNGAVKKLKKKLERKEGIYRIHTRDKQGCQIEVWHWFRGNLSKRLGLRF